MRTTALLISVLSLAAGAPAVAQDAMASHDNMSAMKASPAVQKKIDKCTAMSHDAMMKNAGCAKLMKAHPDMMSHDAMMNH